jgi:hypothetical protein
LPPFADTSPVSSQVQLTEGSAVPIAERAISVGSPEGAPPPPELVANQAPAPRIATPAATAPNKAGLETPPREASPPAA